MGTHKYRSLCPKKKTLGQKAVGYLVGHPWLFIVGVIIIMGIVCLMMWQVNAQADYLMSYGSG